MRRPSFRNKERNCGGESVLCIVRYSLISYVYSISDLPAYTNFCRVFFGRQKKEQANFACSFPQIWKFCLERFPLFRYCMIYDCRTVIPFSSALSSSSFSAIFDIRPVFTSLTASSSLSYSMKRNAIFLRSFLSILLQILSRICYIQEKPCFVYIMQCMHTSRYLGLFFRYQ